MIKDDKTIAVIGAGAVGSILSGHLADIGQEVILVESHDLRREFIEKNGLIVGGQVDIKTRPAVLAASIEELKGKNLLAVFVCTKAWCLKKIAPQLAQVLAPETRVISFQNGIGTENDLAKHLKEHIVARAVVNMAGGLNKESGKVRMEWFNPPNYLGPINDEHSPRMQLVVDILNESGMTTKLVNCHEIKKNAFFKTILNASLNALCANSGITMKQAMTFRHTRHLAKAIIREGLSVASAVGYTYGEDAVDLCLEYLDKGGDHLPSMWSDLVNHAPTEIEYMNGKIAKMGLMFKNIDIDVNIFFTSLIITEEIKSGVRDQEDIPEYLTQF